MTAAAFLTNIASEKGRLDLVALAPLHAAVAQGEFSKVRNLLKQDNYHVNKRPRHGLLQGLTPLFIAAEKNSLAVAEFLIKQGANVNARDEYGWTPLSSAVKENHIEMIDLLLEHNADVNVKSDGGYTPLHMTAISGHEKIVPQLLRYGAEVNAKTKNGWTPLHCAAYFGHQKIVEKLVAPGADVKPAKLDAKTYQKRTPLEIAHSRANTKTTSILEKYIKNKE